MFTHAIAAVFVALPLLAQSALTAECVRSYTVQEGDICDSISVAKNVSTYQLGVVNSGVIDSSCSNLIPGSSICLGYAGEDCSTTYTVVPDDTCEQVAAKNAVNTTILHLNNPQIDTADCSNLYVGEVLCTSPKVEVPLAPVGVSIPGTTIPSTAVPAKPSTTTAPQPTNAPAPVATSVAPASSSEATDASDDSDNIGDDGDDEDVPFCDEL